MFNLGFKKILLIEEKGFISKSGDCVINKNPMQHNVTHLIM